MCKAFTGTLTFGLLVTVLCSPFSLDTAFHETESRTSGETGGDTKAQLPASSCFYLFEAFTVDEMSAAAANNERGIGNMPIQEFNKFTPPGWRPNIPQYPIKLYLELLKLWYRITDNTEAQLGPLVAARLGGGAKKMALRLRLPRSGLDPRGPGMDTGDEALIRLATPQVVDPASGAVTQEAIPSGLQALCQKLRTIYGLRDDDKTTVSLDNFFTFV